MCFRVAPRPAAFALAAAGLLVVSGVAPPAHAQTGWDARLDVTPYPSPYLSDWESNPSIGSLTITNPTSADQEVLLVYRVTDHRGALLASGRSDPQLVVRGQPTVITDFVDLTGSSQHDQGVENQMRRTGRLPEGDVTACVTVTDSGGFVLAEDCVTFSVVYPDPPYLIGPLDETVLPSGHPVLQWTPLQVPPAFQLTYVVRVSEVLTGQAPAHALAANIPVFETTTFGTNLEYPISAPPLEEGKTYVWRVQALDQNGYAASANDGRSENWTFRLGDPAGGGPIGGGMAVTLEVDNTFYGADAGEDDVSAAAEATLRTAPAEDPDAGMYLGLCGDDNWREGRPVRLRLFSPIGFPRRLAAPAQLYRFTVSGSRVWALVGDTQNGNRVMAYGDCDGVGLPWQRWVGIRTVAGSATTGFLMQGNLPQAETPSSEPGLEFGIVVLTLENVTVAAPEGFEIVRSFLEGHEFDAKPGVNAFGILQLEERGWWPYFQAMGFEEKEIEVQGFLGLANRLSMGFSSDSRSGTHGDVSAELEFMNLRAALPPRAFVQPFMQNLFASQQLEVEFAVTDTISRGVTADDQVHHQFHLILNFKHKVALSDDLIDVLGMNPGAEAINTTGLDLSTEEFNRGTTELKLVKRYTLDATWTIGESKFVVGNPELEIGILVAGPNKGDIMFTLSGTAGWGSEDALGKIAITLAKSAALVRSQSTSLSDERIKRWQERLEFTEGELAKATDEAEKVKLREYIEQYRRWIAVERVTIAVARDPTVQRSIRENIATEPRCFRLQGWFCSFRVSLGNASLVDLLAFIREIGFEVAN